MSKERLEEIEGKYTILPVSSKQDGFEYTEVVVEDLVFLIQNGFKQAERVQELEDIIHQDERQAVLEKMYEQNKRYLEAIKEIQNEAKWMLKLSENGEKFRSIYYRCEEALEESE